jgi:hypothetical protein
MISRPPRLIVWDIAQKEKPVSATFRRKGFDIADPRQAGGSFHKSQRMLRLHSWLQIPSCRLIVRDEYEFFVSAYNSRD